MNKIIRYKETKSIEIRPTLTNIPDIVKEISKRRIRWPPVMHQEKKNIIHLIQNSVTLEKKPLGCLRKIWEDQTRSSMKNIKTRESGWWTKINVQKYMFNSKILLKFRNTKLQKDFFYYFVLYFEWSCFKYTCYITIVKLYNIKNKQVFAQFTKWTVYTMIFELAVFLFLFT